MFLKNIFLLLIGASSLLHFTDGGLKIPLKNNFNSLRQAGTPKPFTRNAPVKFNYNKPPLFYSEGGLRLPFTHDFNVSRHGWTPSNAFWRYTRESPDEVNFSNVPGFYSDGDFFWAQTPPTLRQVLSSDIIYGVTNSTKFYIRYWFYNPDPNHEKSLSIDFFYTDDYRRNYAHSISSNSADDWTEAIIDCQHSDCCSNSDTCDLVIWISAYLEGRDASDESGFAAIRCVSTEESACGPLPSLQTTTTLPPDQVTNFVIMIDYLKKTFSVMSPLKSLSSYFN